MVLHHVTERTGLVVIASPLADTDRFADADFDRFDVVTVPQGLPNGVGETEREQVLNRFLAQIVIDSIDLILAQVLAQHEIEPLRGAQVGPKWFFDDDPPPCV